jgi:hypothetical protein
MPQSFCLRFEVNGELRPSAQYGQEKKDCWSTKLQLNTLLQATNCG